MSTPAGICTRTEVSPRVLPSPPHEEQRRSTTRPRPPHCGQGPTFTAIFFDTWGPDPEAPDDPARPRKAFNILVSFAIGSLLGVAGAFLFHHLDNTHPDLVKLIDDKKVLDEEVEAKMREVLDEFAKIFEA